MRSISLAIALCLFWAGAVQAQPMRFSPAEKAWLNDHQRLRVGVVAQTPPIMFFSDKDNPQGLVADYMRALAQHLGLQLEISRFPDAAALMQALSSGVVDVIGAAVPGDEGQGLLIYTRPYLNLPVALFANEELAQGGGLDALRNKTIAVVDGGVWEKALPLMEPSIRIRPQPSLEQALQSVADGAAFAYLGDAASANYLLRRREIGDVEERDRLPLTLDIALATPAGQPELQSLMQKGFDRIDSEELQEIWHRWPGVERPSSYSAGLPALLIWSPLLLGWTLLVGWAVRYETIRRLTQREGKFKRAIRRLQRREKRLKQKLLLLKRKALEYRGNDRQHRQRLLLLSDVMPNSAWVWDPAQAQCQWDDDMYRLFQREPGSFEPTPEAILQCVHAQDRERVAALFERQNTEEDLRFSFRLLLPDGSARWLLAYSHFSNGDGGEEDQRVGICWDITDYMTDPALETLVQPVES
ncbi:MAG: transporter substrate-binding domain-containing protein [Candidatus Thiodiazotropha sp.]